MKVKVMQIDQVGEHYVARERAATIRELRDCFPDDRQGRADFKIAQRHLEVFISYDIGGGAAPFFTLIRI